MQDPIAPRSAPHRSIASRRRLLTAALGLTGPAALATCLTGLAQDATPESGQDASFLIVQAYESGRAHQAMGGSARWRIDLTGQPAISVYFSDRPERAAGLIRTADLLAESDLFGSDPPNAALAFQRDDAGDTLAVATLELISGEINPAIDAVSYQATMLPLDDLPTGEHLGQIELAEALPETFGSAWLFIDSVSVVNYNHPTRGIGVWKEPPR